jgi:excisionase family DNA binding protein
MTGKIDAAKLPRAYDVKTFGLVLGVGKTKTYELIRAGKIRSFKIGSRRRIPADEVVRIQKEGA